MTQHRSGLSAAVLACVLALSGCGGGGGDSSPNNPQPPASGMLGITASNYQAVGQATVSSALFLNDTGGTLTGAEAGDARLLRSAMGVTRHVLGNVPVGAAVLAGAEVRDTVACSQGGSLLLSVNDANNNGNFDLGESITVDAQACKEDGTLMQGRIGLSMQTLTGVFGSSNYSATLAMTLTGFVTTTGNDSVQGDGTLTLSLSQTSAATELTLATTRLALSGRTAGQPYNLTLTDTRLTVRVGTSGGGSQASITYNSTLASSGLGDKQVSITTLQPLMATGTDAYPSSGQLLVKGDAGSTLRITAINATQVRLELDAGGDGTFETSVVKTWAELE